jgi:hypothetical protein
MTWRSARIDRSAASEAVLGHLAALDAERRAHDDDAYAAYARRRKGPERP